MKMSIENYNEYVLDVKNTIISNISYSMLLLLIGIFVVNALSVSSNFESENLDYWHSLCLCFQGLD